MLLTDGPFAETKDQVGGFTMIECANLDEALELASQHPWAKVLGNGRGGPYLIQAAIAACHATAKDPADTDWPQIAALYEQLVALVPSPVVKLNRAVAVGMAEGPAAGLRLVEALGAVRALDGYYPAPVLAELFRWCNAPGAFPGTAGRAGGTGSRRR